MREDPLDVRATEGHADHPELGVGRGHHQRAQAVEKRPSLDLPRPGWCVIFDDPRPARRRPAADDGVGDGVGLSLGRVVRGSDGQRLRTSASRRALLGDVGQLVRHERDVGWTLTGAEEDIGAIGEGPGADRRTRRLGGDVAMHPHAAQIEPEVRLDPRAHGVIDRLATTTGDGAVDRGPAVRAGRGATR
ncbi:MAG: hypothetical protein R3B06_30370 [Kofleriaceae bacterium]